jgi:hypothetical protein
MVGVSLRCTTSNADNSYLCTWRRDSRAPSLNSLSFGDGVFLGNVSSSLGKALCLFVWWDGKDTRIDRFGLVQAGGVDTSINRSWTRSGTATYSLSRTPPQHSVLAPAYRPYWE